MSHAQGIAQGFDNVYSQRFRADLAPNDVDRLDT